MKKIYSLLLTAAALLVGTNAWAGTYNVGTTTEFENAWAKSASEDVVINLTSNQVKLTKIMWLGTDTLSKTPHTVEINLNGYPFESSATYAFMLTRGTLKLTGNGQFTVSGTNAFYVTGSANEDVNPKNDNVNYFSHLLIDEGVIIAHTAYDAAITIDGIWKDGTAFAANNTYIPSKAALNYITNVYANGETGKNKCVANGVRIDLKGTINGRKYGIKTNGYLGSPSWYEKQTYKTENHTIAFSSTMVPSGYKIDSADIDYSAFVHIYPTGRITVQKKDDVHTDSAKMKNPIGVYASGYARWLVEGYVEGCTGAVVKSGEVDFSSATVVGTGLAYNAATESSSGSTASGSAIVITSSESYAGDIDVTIEGDSKVTASNGYAIEENVVAKDSTTKVDAITITGGTFEGGSIPNPVGTGNIEAVMTVSTITALANQDPEEETTITIIGGTASQGSATIGNETLADFLADATTTAEQGQTHITYVDNGKGGTTMVISQGEAPDVIEAGAASWQDGDAINWKHINPATVTPMIDTIKTDLNLKELQMTQNFVQTLRVQDGVTFKAERVILGSKAQIIVEAGGKFIVTGSQGIVAPKPENVQLKHNSVTGKYATFLFNPAVSSNKHPNATVEFTTNSWWVSNEGENYQWEWFGIPTYNQAKAISSKAGNDAVYASVEVFENDTWTDLGYIGGTYDNNPAVLAKLDKPFNAYNLMAYRDPSAAAPTITISGELVGNVNAPLNANMRWNTFANSYTAEIDANALINYLAQHSQNITPAIYVATDAGNSSIQWDAKEAGDIVSLKPMQAFLLNNPNYVDATAIDYSSMVYGFSGNNAPRRTLANDNTAKIRVNVVNENGAWDDVVLRENANTLTIEKYLNSDVNIYVLDGEKNDVVAYENLENAYVGFSTVKGGNFTISFTKAEGREFDLIDLETGVRVVVSEGETYSFSAAANYANDYRFKLVERAKMPTAIENTEVKANVKGIYTITGQYLGEMNVWNTLPAGIYVVNGTKLVK